MKHDFALLKKYTDGEFLSTSIIEMKYAISSFIIDKKDQPITEPPKRQDSVWIEGFTSHSKISGIKKDLDRMITTSSELEKKYRYKPTIHQVLIIPFPKNKIEFPQKLLHIDYKNHNSYLAFYKNNYLSEIKNVIRNQFDSINHTYFRDTKFKCDFCSLPLGKTLNSVEMELHFYVMTVVP